MFVCSKMLFLAICIIKSSFAGCLHSPRHFHSPSRLPRIHTLDAPVCPYFLSLPFHLPLQFDLAQPHSHAASPLRCQEPTDPLAGCCDDHRLTLSPLERPLQQLWKVQTCLLVAATSSCMDIDDTIKVITQIPFSETFAVLRQFVHAVDTAVMEGKIVLFQ